MRKFFSLEGVFTTKNLSVMAMMVALTMVLARITTIYLTPQFKLFTLDYLPGVMVAMMYGPWAAVLFGFVSDAAGYIASAPVGRYHPGFAISDSIHYFIFACFLYKQPFEMRRYIWRVAAARLIVTVAIFLGLNFVWLSSMYGMVAAAYFNGWRMVSNFAFLPVHVAVMVIMARVTQQVRQRSNIAG